MNWIRVPKVPFHVFEKLKSEIQNFIVRFCFYLIFKRNSNTWLPFPCLKEFYFEFLIPSFVFHFHLKNGERNTVRFSFLIFIKELKNELLKNIKINIMVIFTSIVCTLFESKFVSSPPRFSAVQWSCRHLESAVQKTSDVFQCLYYWLLISHLLYSFSQLRYKK